jgi:hypothetical protein
MTHATCGMLATVIACAAPGRIVDLPANQAAHDPRCWLTGAAGFDPSDLIEQRRRRAGTVERGAFPFWFLLALDEMRGHVGWTLPRDVFDGARWPRRLPRRQPDGCLPLRRSRSAPLDASRRASAHP